MHGKTHAMDPYTPLQYLRAPAQEAGAVFGRHDTSVFPLHPGANNPGPFHLYTGRGGRQRWHCFTHCPQGEHDGDAITASRTSESRPHLLPIRSKRVSRPNGR